MEPAKSGSQSNKVLFMKKIDQPPPEEFETDIESVRVRGFGDYSAVGDMAGVGVGVAEREGVTLQELKKKMAEFSRERD
ncbi:dCTP pyrophosphatase 1-like [Pyrus ussuriensis x Pyrus communis]|uniref:dCTP pyrophosphatase 1-like n=1 Tax=Pyrus ussuriensis x Pyrus communis TaxID=2448454 RepID=A0A5N5HA68_9ROSA|nr:dCTP pyrophosphatase 1-like [Pyrus ussuriensis x Pyrus communis]